MLFPNVCLVSAGRFVWHAHDDQTHFKRWIDVMLPAFEQAGIDLTPIFQALIGFLAALVTYKFVPWIQARTTA